MLVSDEDTWPSWLLVQIAQQSCPQRLSRHWGGIMRLRQKFNAAGRVDN
jgi:hypothetical protein